MKFYSAKFRIKPSTRSRYYVCQKVDINHIFIIVGLTKQWAIADPREEMGWGNDGQRMKSKIKRMGRHTEEPRYP